jgi:hypothetical protein
MGWFSDFKDDVLGMDPNGGGATGFYDAADGVIRHFGGMVEDYFGGIEPDVWWKENGFGDMLGDGMDILSNNAEEILGAASIYQQNEWSKEEAQRNRDFQERMSNTAYQRAMADMKEAGLNPILAYKTGGASSPGGSVANIHGLMEGVQQGSAVQAVKSQVKVNDASIAVKNAEATLKEAMIPTAEIVSTISGNIRDLVQAASNILDMNEKKYQAALNHMGGLIAGLMEKAGSKTEEVKAKLDTMLQDATQEAKEWYQSIIDTVQGKNNGKPYKRRTRQ